MTGAMTGGLLTPIGRAETPWARGTCPKNMREARERGASARLVIEPAFRAGLLGLERASHLIVLGWFADADRHVLVQQPKHLSAAQGCFALRTPARPNPVGLSIVRLMSVDQALGVITLEALDWFDGTALIDIKPYIPTVDCIDSATLIEPPRV